MSYTATPGVVRSFFDGKTPTRRLQALLDAENDRILEQRVEYLEERNAYLEDRVFSLIEAVNGLIENSNAMIMAFEEAKKITEPGISGHEETRTDN